MIITVDTTVLVHAVRSRRGASWSLLRHAIDPGGVVRWAATVPLYLEYEAVSRRTEQLVDSGLNEDEMEMVIDALARQAMPVTIPGAGHRPALREPVGELVLEAALVARTPIITHRPEVFAGAGRFGIEVATPATLAARLFTAQPEPEETAP